LTVLGEIGELLLRLGQGFLVWQYLFSKSFRARMHERWRANRARMVGDITGGFVGFVLTILLIVVPFAL
jgi:hypothetical protein